MYKTSLKLLILLMLSSCSVESTHKEHANVASVDALQGPGQRYGELFTAVQMAEVFEDSKTFADALPNAKSEKILKDYGVLKMDPHFSLAGFVDENFTPPKNPNADYESDTSETAEEHITELWDILSRKPDHVTEGTLIPLPHPYVVPGGRFREVYYWDSYFTMLGLQESGRWDLIESMVDNFSYLIDTIGYIPNGNRTYYIGRSQPPFYSLMVQLLDDKDDSSILTKYLPGLEKEYQFWMAGSDQLNVGRDAVNRVVLLKNGEILNRYWDNSSTPRPESYREDVELVNAIDNGGKEHYRHIRAAAESGWDFSSRWFKDGNDMNSINTTDIIPIDLNALLFNLENVLSQAHLAAGNKEQSALYRTASEKRKIALISYCWSEESGFFKDYNFREQQQTTVLSLAAVYPLFFNMASPDMARQVAERIEKDFLKPGGLTSTLKNTGQQWDAPNGWAPLNWLAIKGLRNYSYNKLAGTVAHRWSALNVDVYKKTGKMLEKYNVYDTSLEGGGGEYPVQDGFGWTNGVLLKILKENE
jgi:alpha,alpha-trehalase